MKPSNCFGVLTANIKSWYTWEMIFNLPSYATCEKNHHVQNNKNNTNLIAKCEYKEVFRNQTNNEKFIELHMEHSRSLRGKIKTRNFGNPFRWGGCWSDCTCGRRPRLKPGVQKIEADSCHNGIK